MSAALRVTTPLRLLKEATVFAPTHCSVATSNALAGSLATARVPRGRLRLPAADKAMTAVRFTAAPAAAAVDCCHRKPWPPVNTAPAPDVHAVNPPAPS